MDMKALEQQLYAAFLHAATQMGGKVKGMSCFVKNWSAIKPIADATRAEAVTSEQAKAA